MYSRDPPKYYKSIKKDPLLKRALNNTAIIEIVCYLCLNILKMGAWTGAMKSLGKTLCYLGIPEYSIEYWDIFRLPEIHY